MEFLFEYVKANPSTSLIALYVVVDMITKAFRFFGNVNKSQSDIALKALSLISENTTATSKVLEQLNNKLDLIDRTTSEHKRDFDGVEFKRRLEELSIAQRRMEARQVRFTKELIESKHGIKTIYHTLKGKH